MLDQNTDRMWYVIGAVIIGAALIFIVNSTFPQVFAGVGGTFEDKADETMDIVDGIGGKTFEDVPFDMSDIQIWAYSKGMPFEQISDTAIVFEPNAAYRGGVFIPGSYFEMGETYTMAFDIQKLSGEIRGLGGHIRTSNDVTVTIDGLPTSLWMEVTPGSGNTNDWSKAVVYPNDMAKHHVEVSFTKSRTYVPDDNVYIQPNRTGGESYGELALSYKVLIEHVTLYKH